MKRSTLALLAVGAYRSVTRRCHRRRAARNFAAVSKMRVPAPKKNDTRGPISSIVAPCSSAVSMYLRALAKTMPTSCAGVADDS